jgi:hypothetical protein
MRSLLVLGCLIVATLRCVGVDAVAQENAWDTFVKGRHIDSVLAAVERGDVRRWPFVYSSACDGTLTDEQRQRQSVLRKTSSDLMDDLCVLSTQRYATSGQCLVNSTDRWLCPLSPRRL